MGHLLDLHEKQMETNFPSKEVSLSSRIGKGIFENLDQLGGRRQKSWVVSRGTSKEVGWKEEGLANPVTASYTPPLPRGLLVPGDLDDDTIVEE